MKVEYINPFVQAATEVLERELGCTVDQGKMSTTRSAYTTEDVSVLIGVHGEVRGMVLYCLSEKTASNIAAIVLSQEVPELDEFAQSGIAEISNVITGTAGRYLAEAGFSANISPPTLLIGRGTMVSTANLNRLIIPLNTELGAFEVHIALNATA